MRYTLLATAAAAFLMAGASISFAANEGNGGNGGNGGQPTPAPANQGQPPAASSNDSGIEKHCAEIEAKGTNTAAMQECAKQQ
jgi:hypothetical protein